MFRYFKYAVLTVITAIFIHIGSIVYDAIYNPLLVGQFVHPDIGVKIETLVKRNGYPFEKHIITTQDGYILEIHRIPHGLDTTISPDREPILVMHGLVGSSLQWFSSGIDKALPYYLAKQGYDVWLGNCRGNVYSRLHTKLDADKDPKQFFNFSWHEIGMYDLPAKIDYILNITGKSKLLYAGHSQGSVSFMVMMSEKPEYNNKIMGMLGLAPVVIVNNIRSPTFYIPALFQTSFEWFVEYFGFHELLPKTEFMTQISNRLCNHQSYLQKLCSFIYNINGGFNDAKFNKTLWPVVLSHIPAGSSMKQMIHYTRNIFTDFRKFDYGQHKNLEVYGEKIPPLYDLSKVTVPVGIFYGNNDWLTPEKDILALAKKLPNVALLHKVDDENFSHFDFITSVHAIDILYEKLVQFIKNITIEHQDII